MGGEKIASCTVCRVSMGSPPHGRGKGMTSWGGVLKDRITPAWAGKSRCPVSLLITQRDHPRMGGEKGGRVLGGILGPGSPPHGRGKGRRRLGLALRGGITPAWAGKSTPREEKQAGNKDHPRMGGEKHPLCSLGGFLLGSPPHGRGKAVQLAGRDAVTGITPAWAGKSTSGINRCRQTGDHPRMGGEKFYFPTAHGRIWGSPPRGRGKVQCKDKSDGILRITPAWAGKSYSRCPIFSLSEDHPRVGGEKLRNLRQRSKVLGSPPRGRGKVHCPLWRLFAVGITPAWAGKRHFRNPGFECYGDHPRVGGEKHP